MHISKSNLSSVTLVIGRPRSKHCKRRTQIQSNRTKAKPSGRNNLKQKELIIKYCTIFTNITVLTIIWSVKNSIYVLYKFPLVVNLLKLFILMQIFLLYTTLPSNLINKTASERAFIVVQC